MFSENDHFSNEDQKYFGLETRNSSIQPSES